MLSCRQRRIRQEKIWYPNLFTVKNIYTILILEIMISQRSTIFNFSYDNLMVTYITDDSLNTMTRREGYVSWGVYNTF